MITRPGKRAGEGVGVLLLLWWGAWSSRPLPTPGAQSKALMKGPGYAPGRLGRCHLIQGSARTQATRRPLDGRLGSGLRPFSPGQLP